VRRVCVQGVGGGSGRTIGAIISHGVALGGCHRLCCCVAVLLYLCQGVCVCGLQQWRWM